jgi:hypothetical protein
VIDDRIHVLAARAHRLRWQVLAVLAIVLVGNVVCVCACRFAAASWIGVNVASVAGLVLVSHLRRELSAVERELRVGRVRASRR